MWTDRYFKEKQKFREFRKDTVLKQQDFNQKVEELVEKCQGQNNQITTSEIKDYFSEDKLTAKQEITILARLSEAEISVVMSDAEPKVQKKM